MFLGRSSRMAKKFRWFLLRIVLICMAATYGLGQIGINQRDIDAFGKLTYTLANAGSLQEAVHTLKAEFTLKSRLPSGRDGDSPDAPAQTQALAQSAPVLTLAAVPDYKGTAYIAVNGNEPAFSPELKARKNAFFSFTPLDGLGRCGAAYGKMGPELLPVKPREPIGMIKPTGWRYNKYDDIDGKYLYNRCHLLAFQLTGENANKLNLITGTRYLNVVGMLPFEHRVADYIRRTGNHVLYRVTPIFKGQELVARGVNIEALSVEDEGRGVRFNVFVYNVQPGIEINYANGMNYRK